MWRETKIWNLKQWSDSTSCGSRVLENAKLVSSKSFRYPSRVKSTFLETSAAYVTAKASSTRFLSFAFIKYCQAASSSCKYMIVCYPETVSRYVWPIKHETVMPIVNLYWPPTNDMTYSVQFLMFSDDSRQTFFWRLWVRADQKTYKVQKAFFLSHAVVWNGTLNKKRKLSFKPGLHNLYQLSRSMSRSRFSSYTIQIFIWHSCYHNNWISSTL